MKKIFTKLFFAVIILSSQSVFAQTFPTIYASRMSGSWAGQNAANIWETFAGNATNTPGSSGNGTAQTTSIPSGTHYVYIRAGHTVTMAASRNVLGLTVEAGASLNAGVITSVTLKPNTGNTTTFPPPLNYSVINNGNIGLSNESILVEIPTSAGTTTFLGTGTSNYSRLRMVGGNPNSPIVNINSNINFNIASGYGLTAAYNPQLADNYTINIAAGNTVTLSSMGYFHNNSVNSGAGFGTYTYNINGTLNLSANTSTTSGNSTLTEISNTEGTTNVNIGTAGLLITGATFNVQPSNSAIVNLSVASGGVVDASLATLFNFNGNGFVTSGTAIVKRNASGDGTATNFPLRTPSGNISPAFISRTLGSGTGSYTASVQNNFDNAPANLAASVQKQWNLAITSGTPSTADTIRLAWVTADEGSAFDRNAGVSIMHFVGGTYEYRSAVVSGSGTSTDPYVAKAWGFNGYSPFGVTNLGVVPVRLISFDARHNGKSTDLNWSTAQEINLSNFNIERSEDGVSFRSIATVNANNAANSNYTFNDKTPVNGVAYYRLKMNDLNGAFKHSDLKAVRITKQVGVRLYPNPAITAVVAEHSTEANAINIYSAEGKLVISYKPITGSLKSTVNVAALQPGTYTLIVSDAGGKSSSTFIKQ